MQGRTQVQDRMGVDVGNRGEGLLELVNYTGAAGRRTPSSLLRKKDSRESRSRDVSIHLSLYTLTFSDDVTADVEGREEEAEEEGEDVLKLAGSLVGGTQL